MLPRIERQIERFAPGFRDRVLARAVMSAPDVERYNANYVGGDIAAGVTDIRQFFTRPTWRTSWTATWPTRWTSAASTAAFCTPG